MISNNAYIPTPISLGIRYMISKKKYINLLVNSNITKETKIIPCNKEEYLTAIEINNDFKGDLKTVLKKILQ